MLPHHTTKPPVPNAVCLFCSTPFTVKPYVLRLGKGKYCSSKCLRRAQVEYRGKSLIVRYWKHVQKNADGCWGWNGRCDKDGYGNLSAWTPDGKETTVRAHRVSYELHFGPIPDGIEVCHTCDNPPCSKPEHLFLGTHLANVADMVAKARRPDARGERNSQSTLTESDILLIRSRSDEPDARLAREFGVGCSTISKIQSRKRWTHVL